MEWRSVVVLILASIAAWTDIRERKLYNWNTYLGMVIGFAMHCLPGSPLAWNDSLMGWAACGGLMLMCFVLMPVGGGDVKLMAMLGAGLGLEDGLTALLWTCTLGALLAVGTVIWQVGVVSIMHGTLRRMKFVLTAHGWIPWTDEQKQILNQRFRLGPCALVAVVITRLPVLLGVVGQ